MQFCPLIKFSDLMLTESLFLFFLSKHSSQAAASWFHAWDGPPTAQRLGGDIKGGRAQRRAVYMCGRNEEDYSYVDFLVSLLRTIKIYCYTCYQENTKM